MAKNKTAQQAKSLLLHNIWINPDLWRAWESGSKYVVAHGGRGSAKSMGAGALCILYAINNPGSRILAVRGTQSKISESSLQVLKDIIYMMNYEKYFDITENTLRCKNGSEFLFYGAKSYHSFKSLQGINLVWIDEGTELSYPAWNVLIPTIREEGSRFIITFNAEEEEDYVWKEFIVTPHPQAHVVKINYDGNPYFPEVLKLEMELDKKRDMMKYLHIWEGELRQELEGALWNRDMIKHVSEKPNTEYEKVVVSIDPSVTAKATSDACGLIVAAKKKKNEYVILNDSTAIMSPLNWAKKAVALYHKYNADHITYESNQGGDLIKSVINNIDPAIRCIPVHARRGKKVRAEEILYLYEEGYVTHAKHFKTLEYEMVTFTGNKKDKSPNALDAAVYALKDLAPSKNKTPHGMVAASKNNMRGMGQMSLRNI